MKKTFLSIVGAVLFCIGFAMCTGVDYNPVQALYALVLIGAAGVCFNAAGSIGKREKNVGKRPQVYNYERGILEDAA